MNINKPQSCTDNNNPNAIVEVSYHCKLGDGSVSLSRNIRDFIPSAQTSIDIKINCRSQFSVKVDDTTDDILVTNLLDPVPFKDDIFYLEHQMENKYLLKRLKKKNGVTTQCIVYDATLNKIKLHDCTDTNIIGKYKHWLYWNDGKLSLDLTDSLGNINYKWLTHDDITQKLIVTSTFNDAVSWSFDGSFSGCKDEECINGNIYDNTITFDTTKSKGFSTPNFDPIYRKNSIYINGWLMVSDTIFHNQDTSTNTEYYDSLGMVVYNMYFVEIFTKIISIFITNKMIMIIKQRSRLIIYPEEI